MDEFGEIYRTLFPQVYRYLLALCRDPELAEELTQETFFRGSSILRRFVGSAACTSGCARSESGSIFPG